MGKRNHAARGSFTPRLSEKQMDSLIFQPWFLPRSTYLAIARLVPRQYGLRMRDYFNRYGCMCCRSRTRLHAAHGMCKQCHTEVARRLRRCWKKRLRLLNEQAQKHEIKNIVANAKTAHELLQDLIPPTLKANRSNRKMNFAINPAADLGALASRGRER